MIEDENIIVYAMDNGNQEVFNGDYEDYLAENDYDTELECMLNKLQTKDYRAVIYTNNDGEQFYIKRCY